MFVIASEPEYLFGPWINVLSSIDRVGAAIRGKLECLARKPTFTFTYGAEVIAAVTRLVNAGEGLAKSGPSWVTLRTVLDFVRSECAVIGPRPYANQRSRTMPLRSPQVSSPEPNLGVEQQIRTSSSATGALGSSR